MRIDGAANGRREGRNYRRRSIDQWKEHEVITRNRKHGENCNIITSANGVLKGKKALDLILSTLGKAQYRPWHRSVYGEDFLSSCSSGVSYGIGSHHVVQCCVVLYRTRTVISSSASRKRRRRLGQGSEQRQGGKRTACCRASGSR